MLKLAGASWLLIAWLIDCSVFGGCSAVRLEFDAATVLADVYLTGTWVALDACTDHPFVDAYG